MDKQKYLEIMKERNRICVECQDDWWDGIEKCCKDMMDVVKQDIPGFILFLKTECSSRDYLFITVWFDEFMENIGSQELVDAFRETMNSKFISENQEYNIKQDLDEAIEYYGGGRVH